MNESRKTWQTKPARTRIRDLARRFDRIEINRIPAHSDHKCYAHDPQTNEWSDLRQSLDGEWRVEVVQASDIEFNEEPFVRENFGDSAFERIQVPGHLQMAG